MDEVYILPETPLTQLDTLGVVVGAATCTSPGSWLGSIVQETLT